jgi:hypothetical protein
MVVYAVSVSLVNRSPSQRISSISLLSKQVAALINVVEANTVPTLTEHTFFSNIARGGVPLVLVLITTPEEKSMKVLAHIEPFWALSRKEDLLRHMPVALRAILRSLRVYRGHTGD